MSVRASLRAALVDTYHHSWRLVVLNTSLSAAALAILLVASYVQLALVLVVLVGPLAAALMHAAVTLAETEELSLRDALTGLRLHWRRGLGLALVAAAVVGFGLFALVFYARAGGVALALAALTAYLLVLFAALQLLVWPIAVRERERDFVAVLRDAAFAFLRRPLPALALALALLVVNALGLLAAVLPFLTLTVAYSFVAAAHFALSPNQLQEARHRWQA